LAITATLSVPVPRKTEDETWNWLYFRL